VSKEEEFDFFKNLESASTIVFNSVNYWVNSGEGLNIAEVAINKFR
jgi:hypothetical protein